MTDRRSLPLLALLTVAMLLAVMACSGSTAGSPPSSGTPAGGSVATPEAAAAAVVASEPRLAGIGPLDPNLIGQSAWYEVTPAAGVGPYAVTVHLGWGDCPAGCINQHTWTYTVAADGTVTLESESGDEPVPDEAWPAS